MSEAAERIGRHCGARRESNCNPVDRPQRVAKGRRKVPLYTPQTRRTSHV